MTAPKQFTTLTNFSKYINYTVYQLSLFAVNVIYVRRRLKRLNVDTDRDYRLTA